MKATKVLYGLAFGLIIYLGISSFNGFPFSTIKGSGTLSKETRDLAVFHGIDAGGAFHITVKQGEPQSVIIEADDNIIPVITTKVKSGILHISTNESINNSTKLNVTIVVANLDMLDLSGACKLKSTEAISSNEMEIDCSGASEIIIGLKCKKLEIDFSGASTGIFLGKTSTLEIESSGASKIDCYKMIANVVSVDASGASNISFSADKIIKIDASGASSINYKSNGATLEIETSGAASTHKK